MIYKPKCMNLEVTDKCPLRCPQCYCFLNGKKVLKKETAFRVIDEAAKIGIEQIEISGGETLCYPYLYDVIKYANSKSIKTHAAFSGWHFTQQVYEKLLESGISNIYISLNGSTEKINSITRDGYNYAIEALSLLKKNKYSNTIINWVMHSNNADDFINVVKLADYYEVSMITILAFKPDSNNQLESFPTSEQIYKIASLIKSIKCKVKITVESCFSQLLAVVNETKLFGNLNFSPLKGCTAGRMSLSVSVDGLFSPCRHIYYFEKYESLQEYWENSTVLETIRNVERNREKPCLGCRYENYCRHCLAVNANMNNRIYIGNSFCPLSKE